MYGFPSRLSLHSSDTRLSPFLSRCNQSSLYTGFPTQSSQTHLLNFWTKIIFLRNPKELLLSSYSWLGPSRMTKALPFDSCHPYDQRHSYPVAKDVKNISTGRDNLENWRGSNTNHTFFNRLNNSPSSSSLMGILPCFSAAISGVMPS